MFEYDPIKSQINAEKHGIDFKEAQKLWDDIELVFLPSKNTDEPRYLSIGLIESRYWTAITTEREGKIRIISVRRSRKKEIELYESQITR